MSEEFIAPYPVPHKGKLSLVTRLFFGWDSWIHTLFEKSYTMKMGEVKLPRLDFYVANDSELVRRVLEEEPQHFPKHHLLHELLQPLIGDSAFSVNGEDWANKRAMMNPSFVHTALDRTFGMMCEASEVLIARIKAQDLQKPVLIDTLMTHVTGDIIYRTIFSRSLSAEEATHIYDAFHDYQKFAQPVAFFRLYGLPQFYYRNKLRKAAAHIHSVFTPMLEARYQAFQEKNGDTGHHDILHSLMQAKHPVSGEPFTFQQLLDEISLIFLAGHETSASALTWALYLLSRCPHMQEQAFSEILAHEAGQVSRASVRNYHTIRNVFKETLRLYPPISFFIREVVAPTQMRDKKMKKGAMLVIAPWLLHRNKNQFPCPHSFKPERFEDPAQAEACKHAYLPFGKGPRTCIGAGFAQQEGLVILAYVIKHFRITSAPGEEPKPVSRLTLRPKHGIQLSFTPRIGAPHDTTILAV